MILNHKRAIELLRDVFVRACERSGKLRGNPIRSDCVIESSWARWSPASCKVGWTNKPASIFVRDESRKLPEAAESAHFAEIAETELAGLHEGDFAQIQIRPSEFAPRKSHWR